jgi:hypothetical protein
MPDQIVRIAKLQDCTHTKLENCTESRIARISTLQDCTYHIKLLDCTYIWIISLVTLTGTIQVLFVLTVLFSGVDSAFEIVEECLEEVVKELVFSVSDLDSRGRIRESSH